MTVKEMLWIHAAATFWMIAVIWTVQLKFYPSFLRVSDKDFSAHYARYMKKIGWFVTIPMLTEFLTGVWFVFACGADPRYAFFAAGLGLIVLLWLSTALIQVPLHRKLKSGCSREAQHKLVATNWLRTVLWSVRGIVVLFLLKG